MFPLLGDTPTCASPHTPRTACKANGGGYAGSIKRLRGLEDPAQSVSRASVRRLARRAGVKRIGSQFHQDAEACLRRFLGTLVKDISIITEHARRRTVTVGDVLLVLKRNGRTLYGFEEKQRKRRLTQRLPTHSLAESTSRVFGTAPPVAAAAAPPPRQAGAARPQGVSLTPSASSSTAVASAGGKPADPQPLAPRTPQPMTPDRAQDIQVSLSSFRDTVLERQSLSSATVPEAMDWVAAELARTGRSPCSATEFEVVLDALDRRNAIMLDGEGDLQTRTLYFL